MIFAYLRVSAKNQHRRHRMISALHSAQSALNAFGTRLQSNGNNIANTQTEGFKKTRIINKEASPQGVTTQVDKVSTPGNIMPTKTSNGLEMIELSNVDLTTEIPDMTLNANIYKANLKTIETVDQMTGTVLDLKS
ncbi:MAG: flagellar biosynthesis protein FlgC [Desulfobacterales bacterium]|nr:MAG: flagellar biosynthesis protein FlgC [Desulfobacterales bacterium]